MVMLALQVSILCTVFGFGLKATPDDLLYVIRHPGLLARSITAMLLVMPVLAIAAVELFGLRHTTAVVLVVLSISPVPPLLPQRQAKGGGERSYGLGLMAWCALLAIAVVPVWITVLGRIFGHEFVASPREIARVLLVAAIAPLLAGMAVRALSTAVADRLARPVIVDRLDCAAPGGPRDAGGFMAGSVGCSRRRDNPRTGRLHRRRTGRR